MCAELSVERIQDCFESLWKIHAAGLQRNSERNFPMMFGEIAIFDIWHQTQPCHASLPILHNYQLFLLHFGPNFLHICDQFESTDVIKGSPRMPFSPTSFFPIPAVIILHMNLIFIMSIFTFRNHIHFTSKQVFRHIFTVVSYCTALGILKTAACKISIHSFPTVAK